MGQPLAATPNMGIWNSNIDFSPLYFTRRLGIGEDPLLESLSTAKLIWSEPWTTRQVIEDMLGSAIKSGQYDVALSAMNKLLFSCTNALARCFERTFDHTSSAPILIQELKDAEVLGEQEYNRLTVLVMVLNSIEYEVSGYGGKLDLDIVEYLREYCQIVETILSRNGVTVDLSELIIRTDVQNKLADRPETIADEYVTEAREQSVTNSQGPL